MSSSPVGWSGTVTLPGLTAFAAAAEVLGPAKASADTGWDVVPQAVVHTGVPFEWVHLPFDRALFAASDWAVELKLLMATMDRRLVAETTVLDILLMSEADYVIGTLSSHFGALAYELSVSSKGFHVPYISLDFPWRSSLLSPVSYYDDTGTTRDRVELNLNRRDFFQHKRDTHEPV